MEIGCVVSERSTTSIIDLIRSNSPAQFGKESEKMTRVPITACATAIQNVFDAKRLFVEFINEVIK